MFNEKELEGFFEPHSEDRELAQKFNEVFQEGHKRGDILLPLPIWADVEQITVSSGFKPIETARKRSYIKNEGGERFPRFHLNLEGSMKDELGAFQLMRLSLHYDIDIHHGGFSPEVDDHRVAILRSALAQIQDEVEYYYRQGESKKSSGSFPRKPDLYILECGSCQKINPYFNNIYNPNPRGDSTVGSSRLFLARSRADEETKINCPQCHKANVTISPFWFPGHFLPEGEEKIEEKTSEPELVDTRLATMSEISLGVSDKGNRKLIIGAEKKVYVPPEQAKGLLTLYLHNIKNDMLVRFYENGLGDKKVRSIVRSRERGSREIAKFYRNKLNLMRDLLEDPDLVYVGLPEAAKDSESFEVKDLALVFKEGSIGRRVAKIVEKNEKPFRGKFRKIRQGPAKLKGEDAGIIILVW